MQKNSGDWREARALRPQILKWANRNRLEQSGFGKRLVVQPRLGFDAIGKVDHQEAALHGDAIVRKQRSRERDLLGDIGEICLVLRPELLALWVGLSVYAAAFIAEIVRSAINAIQRGQSEAARSLGLTRGQTMRLVILPQALRLIIPPLTSQYLNVIKSSSLGAAIAYPEVFLIVGGTTLNQTGQAIESMAIVMAVFLVINLATAALMNWYNRAVALKER